MARLPCVEPSPSDTNPQSPGAGAVALPSPFVSPPTESSRKEVKYTGSSAVPSMDTGTIPLNLIDEPAMNLTTTPGLIVSDPSRTYMEPSTTYGLFSLVHVWFHVSFPPGAGVMNVAAEATSGSRKATTPTVNDAKGFMKVMIAL